MKNTTRIFFIVFALTAFCVMMASAENNPPRLPDVFFNGDPVHDGQTVEITTGGYERSMPSTIFFTSEDGADIYYRFLPHSFGDAPEPDFSLYSGEPVTIEHPGILEYYAQSQSEDGEPLRSETASIGFDIVTPSSFPLADSAETVYYSLDGLRIDKPDGICIRISQGKSKLLIGR